MSTSTRRLAFPARNLCFTSVDEENRLQIAVIDEDSGSCREFTLTDEQAVLLWEQLGHRVAALARTHEKRGS